MTACLVTGGAGFIGSNLADRLASEGAEVVVLDDCSRRGSDLNLAWLRERHGAAVRLVRADVGDAAAVARAVAEAEVVYHLAGQTAVTTSVVEPRRDFVVNALGTLNVLEAARRSDERPVVVYASTNKVYGPLDGVPLVATPTRYDFRDLGGVPEEFPIVLDSPYACSKGVGDQYALAYARLYGVSAIVLRQSCVYGPRQMGVEDQGWVAWFLLAALFGRPVTVFGDGRQVRDLLYIDDLLAAYSAAVENVDRTAGEAYNLGGGAERTVSVWAEFEPLLREALAGTSPDVRFAGWRPGDQRVFYCDTRKAERELDWRPQVGVRQGLAELADWLRENQQSLAAFGAS